MVEGKTLPQQPAFAYIEEEVGLPTVDHCTFVLRVILLFAVLPSEVVVLTSDPLTIVVPELELTLTVSMIGPHECPASNEPLRVHVKIPVPPVAGCAQLPGGARVPQPLGAKRD
jgi:hypothetical protein